MAGRGPAGKDRHARSRNDVERTELAATGKLFGPDLPEGVLPKGEAWHPQTLAWWRAIRAFPLLENEPAMGWQFLIDTALMHHMMWTKGRWDFAAEIRLRVAKYGATPEDRMRLKIKVVVAGEPQPTSGRKASAKVTDIGSRRSRLTG